MEIMTQVSNFIIPAVIFYVVGYGMVSGVKTYESFLKGAKDGLRIVVDIMPTLIGLMVGVSVLRASGFFDLIGKIFAPVTETVNLPTELVPLMIVKLFSSSAATGLVLDVFETLGPDSAGGRIASIMMSCTETVFYTMSVYFLAAKVTKTRYTLTGALLATFAGTVASIVLGIK